MTCPRHSFGKNGACWLEAPSYKWFHWWARVLLLVPLLYVSDMKKCFDWKKCRLDNRLGTWGYCQNECASYRILYWVSQACNGRPETVACGRKSLFSMVSLREWMCPECQVPYTICPEWSLAAPKFNISLTEFQSYIMLRQPTSESSLKLKWIVSIYKVLTLYLCISSYGLVVVIPKGLEFSLTLCPVVLQHWRRHIFQFLVLMILWQTSRGQALERRSWVDWKHVLYKINPKKFIRDRNEKGALGERMQE